MKFEEFDKYIIREDSLNPFCNFYANEFGDLFYVEPVFHTQLMGFKMHHSDRFDEIMIRIDELIRKNHRIVFTGNFEFPQTVVKENDYIYLEINDITDPLQIFVEDKSRGSDYGD